MLVRYRLAASKAPDSGQRVGSRVGLADVRSGSKADAKLMSGMGGKRTFRSLPPRAPRSTFPVARSFYRRANTS